MRIVKRAILPAVIVIALVVAAFTMFSGGETKTVTAHFPRTISIYEGSDVRVLGVPVGTVDTVTPSGTDVVVKMTYDADVKIPADAKAAIVAPSIVGDRFVQLTPVYTGGDVLADGEVLDEDRTAVPLELDQIYTSLDDLTVALGPTGANQNGALSDLLETTAENFGGQGAKFHQTIEDFGKLSATLDDNKEELFGSARELQGFIGTLAQNDSTVRRFNTSLSDVSTMLAGERQELTASLANLAEALGQVKTFVADNREVLGRNITGLNRVSKVLVKQRDALAEVLEAGPLALNNLALTYNPRGRHPRHQRQPRRDRQPGRVRPVLVHLRHPLAGRPVGAAVRPGPDGAAAHGRPRPAPGRRHVGGPLRRDARWIRGGGPMKRTLRALVAVLAGAILLTGCDFDVYELPLPGGTDTGDDPITVTVEFQDVLDLVPQSTVKVDDVSVGKVTDVELEGQHAVVTLELRNDVDLPGERDRRDPPDQPARREVRVAEPARGRRRHGRARGRRRHPARPHRPQPRGRGGPRRAAACCSTAAASPS